MGFNVVKLAEETNLDAVRNYFELKQRLNEKGFSPLEELLSRTHENLGRDSVKELTLDVINYC